MPVLAGVEAVVAVPKARAPWKKAPGAETGCLETLREFAARTKNFFSVKPPKAPDDVPVESSKAFAAWMKSKKFVVHSPKEQSGVMVEPLRPVAGDPVPVPLAQIHMNEHVNSTPGSLVTLVAKADSGIDLLKVLRGAYAAVKAFKPVLEWLKDY
ncbi:hypothetical protein H0H81_001945 [Sphagnurus paluster]|uniref:Uncharacterized protein n=1 Tax=Sphagnurus paluster TaxID=117069 RepID=A0A9P7K2S2_9AGAR|nr:hypothetical protein H0H81_001945 [Sphagnurus paluster]